MSFQCGVLPLLVYVAISLPCSDHYLLQGRRKTAATSDNRPFLRDLILLSGPSDTTVPRQGVRVELSEHGHIITECQFTKNMTAAQVEIRIMEVFEGKIPRLVDIELLISVHTALVKPNLAPDQQGIDGVILHRLFKNKPVYIRPSCELLDSTQMERRESRVTIIFIIFIIITYLKTVTLHHTYLYV